MKTTTTIQTTGSPSARFERFVFVPLFFFFIFFFILLLRVLFVVSKNRRFFSFHLDLDFFFLSSLRMARFWDI
tara:strand:- start:1593 stop:1811 length:219 start_codon:yes stop_codon:yes gene_type:complete